MQKLIEFGREVQREVQKIAWPSVKEIWVTTAMIVAMAVVASIFLFFADWAISKIVKLLLTI